MREIKFRVWRPRVEWSDKKGFWEQLGMEMVYDPEIDCEGTHINRILSKDYRSPWGDSFWMQCTGLKDKGGRGKDIYEGDIVSFEVENQVSGLWVGPNRGEIVFDVDRLCYAIKGKAISGREVLVTIDHGYDAYSGTLRVLGNVYENPDLMDEYK